jgi:hypothetical protein
MCPAFWKRDKEDVFFHMLVRTGMLDTDDMSVSCNFNRKRLLTSESGITMRLLLAITTTPRTAQQSNVREAFFHRRTLKPLDMIGIYSVRRS